MTTLENLSSRQLQQALTIRQQIETLQEEIVRVLGGTVSLSPTGRPGMSASARARIGAAQKARWAKIKTKTATGKPKRTMSAKARAAISAAAKLRWQKAKAAGKNTL